MGAVREQSRKAGRDGGSGCRFAFQSHLYPSLTPSPRPPPPCPWNVQHQSFGCLICPEHKSAAFSSVTGQTSKTASFGRRLQPCFPFPAPACLRLPALSDAPGSRAVQGFYGMKQLVFSLSRPGLQHSRMSLLPLYQVRPSLPPVFHPAGTC